MNISNLVTLAHAPNYIGVKMTTDLFRHYYKTGRIEAEVVIDDVVFFDKDKITGWVPAKRNAGRKNKC